MPSTGTARMKQIAEDLESEGFYTSAESVHLLTEQRDKLLDVLRNLLMATEDWALLGAPSQTAFQVVARAELAKAGVYAGRGHNIKTGGPT